MPALHRLTCVLIVLLSVGCVTTANTYEVRRAALVPALQPPMRSGRPIDGRVQVVAHASQVLGVEDAAANAASNTYVAQTTLGMAARFRVGRIVDIGPLLQVGLGGGDAPEGPAVAARPAGNTLGTGVSVQVAPRFEDARFGLAAAVDVMLFSIPVREEWWCLDCGGPPRLEESHEEGSVTPIYSLSLLPSFQPSPDFTVFGGMTLRNQPAVRTGDLVVSEAAGSGDSDGELQSGPVNVVASLGAEANLGAGAHVLLQASQPLTDSPVSYGPSVAAGLSWAFGEPATR